MLTIRELAGTEGLEYIGKALADGSCPIFTLNIKDTQVIRLPLHFLTYLKRSDEARASYECSVVKIRKPQVIRLPLHFQDAKCLKEIVSEDNPILFPPKEIMQRGAAQIIDFLRDQRVKQSIREAEAALEEERKGTSAYVSIRQHTSACVSMRQHTSAYVSIVVSGRRKQHSKRSDGVPSNLYV
jgi:hypothetical protein